MRNSLILIGLFLVGLLLIGCTSSGSGSVKDVERSNPLTAEVIADQMIEYTQRLQIRAQEAGNPVTDPAILRAIDDVFVEARALQTWAHDIQDEGKEGGFYGVNDNYAVGPVLLVDDMLYVGYGLEIHAAPHIRVYLSSHVSPKTPEELFGETVKDVGELKSFYTAHQYDIGTLSDEEWNAYRTVALYSKPLDTVIALAQIRGAVR